MVVAAIQQHVTRLGWPKQTMLDNLKGTWQLLQQHSDIKTLVNMTARHHMTPHDIT
jgi:hypothetical protein